MTAEQASETVEIVTAAVDKFLSTENYEVSPTDATTTNKKCFVVLGEL
jgi:hypothetical protein